MSYSFNTKEEYLQFAKDLMVDLRGDWSHSYASRIYTLKELMENIITDHPDLKDEAIEVMGICDNQLEGNDFQDGRYFRDCCSMYEWEYNEGQTMHVKKALYETCNNPEDRWFDEDAR